MSIQCIALDMDRTTLDASGHLSPGNRQALEHAIRKGVQIVIASGRSFSNLPRDVVSIPGIEYAITSNGAAVCRIPSGQRLRSYTLPPRAVEDILRLTQSPPVAYETFVDGVAYAGAAYVRDPLAYGATPQSVPYIQRTRHPESDIQGFLRAHIDRLDSLNLVVNSEAEKERLRALLARSVPDIYITSSVQQLVEISHHNCGKGAGIRFLTELLGLSREQVAAFGDADNDVDMLTFAGCGIAMANASPACLAAADAVTKHHDQDGVAYGIYELLHI